MFRKRGTKEGSFNELLADYFATCILMPKEWVTEKWVEVKDLDRVSPDGMTTPDYALR